MPVDLFRMRCFVHVAEQLNLTRAALRAGITQPAMSVQMRELERELDLDLLRRDKGHITLTDAGEVVYQRFREILGAYDNMLAEARTVALSHPKKGMLKTGYHGSLTAFAKLYQGFGAAEPDIEVSVRVEEWLQLANMVAAGELDAVFVERHEAELRPELATMPFFSETYFCVAVGAGHPFARESSVTIEQLQGEQLLMSGYKSASIDAMYRQLLSNGLRKERVRIVENVDAAIAMAASGMGLATMPRFLAMPGNPAVTWVPVSGLDFACDIVLAWRRDNGNRCLGSFIEYCSLPEVVERLRAEWIPTLQVE